MRFCLLVVLICAGTAQAQRGSYFGFGVSYYATFAELSTNYLYPSLQIGGPISIGELRGTLESILLSSNLGLDVLYPIALDIPNTKLYAGGDVSTRLYFIYPYNFDLRAVVGGEYFFAREGGSAPPGIFGEVRTYLKGLLTSYPTVEGRVGINLPL